MCYRIYRWAFDGLRSATACYRRTGLALGWRLMQVNTWTLKSYKHGGGAMQLTDEQGFSNLSWAIERNGSCPFCNLGEYGLIAQTSSLVRHTSFSNLIVSFVWAIFFVLVAYVWLLKHQVYASFQQLESVNIFFTLYKGFFRTSFRSYFCCILAWYVLAGGLAELLVAILFKPSIT